MHLVFQYQFLVNIIEDPFHKLTTLRGTVILGQINVLVNGHLGRNGFKKKEFANTHLHQDHIQRGNTVGITVL